MKTLLSLLVCSFTAAVPLLAETLAAVTAVSFSGTSTLHDFQGKATSSPTTATWLPAENGGTLNIETLSFDVKSLNTDHKKRDQNMMKMFEVEKHPTIQGKIKDWHLEPGKSSTQTLELNIHGVTLNVPVNVTAFSSAEEGYHLSATFTLSLKTCTLKRPSVLGLIRVGDEVTLQVETTLRRP